MKVLLSAQDPGGANAVIPVAVEMQKRGDAVVAMAEGAARDMCAARGIALSDMSDPDVILFGTSGGESVEKRVLLQMRGKAPTVAVLDFWSNYWQRFSGPGTKDFKYLPDMVCVMDDIARDEMLAEGFPPERIAVTGNPHFDHFADGITRESEDQKRVLFISQPIRADTKIPGLARPPSDEYDALDALCAALPAGHMLSIRLHPRDTRNKYDRYLNSRITIAAERRWQESAVLRTGYHRERPNGEQPRWRHGAHRFAAGAQSRSAWLRGRRVALPNPPPARGLAPGRNLARGRRA